MTYNNYNRWVSFLLDLWRAVQSEQEKLAQKPAPTSLIQPIDSTKQTNDPVDRQLNTVEPQIDVFVIAFCQKEFGLVEAKQEQGEGGGMLSSTPQMQTFLYHLLCLSWVWQGYYSADDKAQNDADSDEYQATQGLQVLLKAFNICQLSQKIYIDDETNFEGDSEISLQPENDVNDSVNTSYRDKCEENISDTLSLSSEQESQETLSFEEVQKNIRASLDEYQYPKTAGHKVIYIICSLLFAACIFGLAIVNVTTFLVAVGIPLAATTLSLILGGFLLAGSLYGFREAYLAAPDIIVKMFSRRFWSDRYRTLEGKVHALSKTQKFFWGLGLTCSIGMSVALGALTFTELPHFLLLIGLGSAVSLPGVIVLGYFLLGVVALFTIITFMRMIDYYVKRDDIWDALKEFMASPWQHIKESIKSFGQLFYSLNFRKIIAAVIFPLVGICLIGFAIFGVITGLMMGNDSLALVLNAPKQSLYWANVIVGMVAMLPFTIVTVYNNVKSLFHAVASQRANNVQAMNKKQRKTKKSWWNSIIYGLLFISRPFGRLTMFVLRISFSTGDAGPSILGGQNGSFGTTLSDFSGLGQGVATYCSTDIELTDPVNIVCNKGKENLNTALQAQAAFGERPEEQKQDALTIQLTVFTSRFFEKSKKVSSEQLKAACDTLDTLIPTQ